MWYPPEQSPAAPLAQSAGAPPTATVRLDLPGAAPAMPDGVAAANPWIRLGAYLLEPVLMIVTLGIGWLVWAFSIGGTGQTPAKRLLGLRVIRADTLQPAGLARMFWLRGIIAGWVVSLAALFTLGIILFMPFWDKRNQNLWDKVSTTYVVTDPNDAWNTKPSLT